MGECLSKPKVNNDAYVREERQPQHKPGERGAGAGGQTRDRERGRERPDPPVTRPPPSSGRDRLRNDTVDFQDFKDREKNVVETMLESNKGLRMAEISFGDLKLQKIIGAGAFGEVIKGTYCGTPVVVKRMLRNKIDENNLRMFGDEIQLMMNLRHPNIVQFIGASWNSYSNMYVPRPIAVPARFSR
jgi:serine/threonine protein kinase